SDDLINVFTIYYNKDHRKEGNSPGNYLKARTYQHFGSINTYGRKEWKGGQNIFLWDAISIPAMAHDVAEYLLTCHSSIRKMPCFRVFLDNMEVEPGDILDLTHPLDSMIGFKAEALKILHELGSARRKKIDRLKVIAIEN
ncbi:hypothetical protein GW916_15990, partial [bacterium]|nr:hypothetical protein [bacterium]